MESWWQFTVAANASSYANHPLVDALSGIRGAGFESVELNVAPESEVDMALGDPTELTAMLRRAGLRLVAVTSDADLSTPSGLQHATRVLTRAANLGVSVVNVAVGDHPASEIRAPFQANFVALARSAKSAGITLGLEPHGRLTPTGHSTLRILQDMDRAELGRIGVTYDTANVEFYGGVRAVDDLPEVVASVVHCHLKDKRGGRRVWHFPPLGLGTVDIPRLLGILARANYGGIISVEVEFRGEPWPDVASVDAALVRSYGYLETLGVT